MIVCMARSYIQVASTRAFPPPHSSTVVDPSCELSGRLSLAERDEIVGDARQLRVQELRRCGC